MLTPVIYKVILKENAETELFSLTIFIVKYLTNKSKQKYTAQQFITNTCETPSILRNKALLITYKSNL